jgi:hypothetical protein
VSYDEGGTFSCLFWTVLISVILLSIAYFVAFKLYFTQDRLSSQINNFVYSTFHRNSQIDHASFSPIGKFEFRNLQISKRGASAFRPQGSINALQANVKMYRLPLGQVWIDDFYIDAFNLTLTYDGLKKFNYLGLLEDINKFITSKPFLKTLIVDKINISAGEIFLISGKRTFIFRNVLLESDKLDADNFLNANLSFDAGTKNINQTTHFSATLRFDKSSNIIYVSDIRCNTIALPMEGKIFLKDNDILSAQFSVSTLQRNIRRVLVDIIGQDLYKEFDSLIDDMKGELKVVYLK